VRRGLARVDGLPAPLLPEDRRQFVGVLPGDSAADAAARLMPGAIG